MEIKMGILDITPRDVLNTSEKIYDGYLEPAASYIWGRKFTAAAAGASLFLFAIFMFSSTHSALHPSSDMAAGCFGGISLALSGMYLYRAWILHKNNGQDA